MDRSTFIFGMVPLTESSPIRFVARNITPRYVSTPTPGVPEKEIGLPKGRVKECG
ncbi:hypothetical protein APS_2441 [Acetobacter pasteurianus subsp. pasteurianus LMG 1262 = NBRC 106471]|nr:hypothetical protein APS_2441 [Acetobacter pasteurianus subsp. pasteurianus LMG 1262 = NBRC 106471]